VVNAVVDAVRHLGVSDIQMPCTPERVWRAIHANDGDAPTPETAMPHFADGALNQDEGAGQ
jgi:carbon-monoxide dehydrogenase large subunit